MEQATNLFTRGMLLDVNPMMQGNDSLSDCLNGTIITMAGNEGILQNDMGNRLVKDTYLPEGYIPVGIKEYGGIIYIASYNPLTKKGLLGSFPAPEQWVEEKYEKDYDINFEFNTIQDSNYYENIDNHFTYLNLTSKIYALDNVLHIGDQFALCLELNENITENITQPDDSIKRKYSLSIGVLNELNKFYEIVENPTFEENLQNKNNLTYTFNEKVSGQLALKIVLNIPLSVTYSIEGHSLGNNKYELIIVGDFIYNSPINGIYFFKGRSNLTGNNPWIKYTPEIIKLSSETEIENNLFNKKITWKISSVECNDNNLNYFIGYKADPLIFVKELSLFGSLDCNLFYSNVIEIKNWQFVTNENITTLYYSIDIISKISNEDLTLKIILTDVENDSLTIPIIKQHLDSYEVSGQETISNKLGNAYKVKIELIYDNLTLDSEENYWIICTKLLNNCYSNENKDFTKSEDVKEKLNIKISPSYTVEGNISDKNVEYNNGQYIISTTAPSSVVNYTSTNEVEIMVKNVELSGISDCPNYVKDGLIKGINENCYKKIINENETIDNGIKSSEVIDNFKLKIITEVEGNCQASYQACNINETITIFRDFSLLELSPMTILGIWRSNISQIKIGSVDSGYVNYNDESYDLNLENIKSHSSFITQITHVGGSGTNDISYNGNNDYRWIGVTKISDNKIIPIGITENFSDDDSHNIHNILTYNLDDESKYYFPYNKLTTVNNIIVLDNTSYQIFKLSGLLLDDSFKLKLGNLVKVELPEDKLGIFTFNIEDSESYEEIQLSNEYILNDDTYINSIAIDDNNNAYVNNNAQLGIYYKNGSTFRSVLTLLNFDENLNISVKDPEILSSSGPIPFNEGNNYSNLFTTLEEGNISLTGTDIYLEDQLNALDMGSKYIITKFIDDGSTGTN